ncbi:hypothetical protein BAE44_0022901 [Dichanthelium oligosanthes]|uniref:DUF7595 domain-containing protein n=1 Tax=Dichanthelium oligosanthes TaxID=888268 RepID=A0A1E5UT93_9POAL|nr:hypothetical protein BAE44_0022901 [Dichanthelium oligosanthes]
MIDKILSHITDPASLARLASTCKFWRNIIKGRTFLDCLSRRRHDHGFTPSLLLRFFYQDSTESPPQLSQHHKGKWCSLAPSFMPISELSQSIGSRVRCNALAPAKLCTFIRGLGAELNLYEPIASQDGFLALRHRPKGTNDQAQSDKLCVCNPLTGEIFHIPRIPVASPDMYTLHVTEDVNRSKLVSQSFQLVAIWIRQRTFGTGFYCSKAKRWMWFSDTPELIPDLYAVRSPAAASHGAIHFLCGSSTNWTLTHIVTLHVAAHPKLSYLEVPLDAKRSKAPLLANSADGSFLLLLLKGLQVSLWKHCSDTSSWVLSETINLASSLPPRVVQMRAREKIKLEMFLGKSGAVVLWVDGEGLFLFNLSDGLMRKIGDERATKKYSFCPYEIDWLSCLSIMNLVVDGSLLLDAGRKTIQCRWRKTVARHMKKSK